MNNEWHLSYNHPIANANPPPCPNQWSGREVAMQTKHHHVARGCPLIPLKAIIGRHCRGIARGPLIPLESLQGYCLIPLKTAVGRHCSVIAGVLQGSPKDNCRQTASRQTASRQAEPTSSADSQSADGSVGRAATKERQTL